MSAAVAAPTDEPIHELNTTPLIDVMLVLLILFILTIPIQMHSVEIDLPGPPIDVPVHPDRNKIAVDANGAVLWNGVPVDMAQLRTLLARLAPIRPAPELQVEPHPEARYEKVDEVLAVIRRADIVSMGFVGNERYRSF